MSTRRFPHHLWRTKRAAVATSATAPVAATRKMRVVPMKRQECRFPEGRAALLRGRRLEWCRCGNAVATSATAPVAATRKMRVVPMKRQECRFPEGRAALLRDRRLEWCRRGNAVAQERDRSRWGGASRWSLLRGRRAVPVWQIVAPGGMCSRPGGRAVDRAAVRERHHIWQLAAGGQVAGDVSIVCRCPLKVF